MSLLRQYELCSFKMFGWISLPCHCRSINLPDLTCQVDVRVGYYTSVYGLGRHPRDTQVRVFLGKNNLHDEDEHSKEASRSICRLKIKRHGPKSKRGIVQCFCIPIFSNFIWQSTMFCQGKSRIDVGVIQNSGTPKDHTGYPQGVHPMVLSSTTILDSLHM